MQIKKIIYILAITLLTTNLTSCYDSKEIDDMVYILAIGVDKYTENENIYTLQAAVPLNIDGGVETGFATSEESVTIQNISVTSDNLLSAIETANASLAKEINISHCKIVLFSQGLSSTQFKNNITTINQFNKFSPNTMIAMCEEKASEYLDKISSPFEKNPARYYSMYFKKDFSSNSFNAKISDFEKRDILAIPLLGENNSTKAAILNNYKNILTLSESETFAYNLLNGTFAKGNITVNDNRINTSIQPSSSPKIKINANGTYPAFKIELNLEGKIFSYGSDETNSIKLLEKYIEKNCLDFLEKIKSYNVDVLSLNKFLRSKFPTLSSYETYDWKNKFPHSKFEVKVNFKSIK